VATFDGVHWYIRWCTLVHSMVYTESYRWRHSMVYTGTFDGVHWYIRWFTLNPICGDIRWCTLVHSMVYTESYRWRHSMVYTGAFDGVHWYIRWCTLNPIGGDIRWCTLVHSMVYTGALTIVYTDRMLSNVPSLTTLGLARRMQQCWISTIGYMIFPPPRL
jgi:hypothetical protein